MPKKQLSPARARGDIDFEKELWDATNELHGAVAENQYKGYVLSLLFLKHLSERYELRQQEIRQAFSDPKSAYYTIHAEEQIEVLEDELEYQVKTT